MDERRTRFWAVALTAPMVLVAVAGLQLVRAHTLDQSSWSGGGFGMFATSDNEDSRFVRVWAVTDDGEELLGLPADLDREAFEARVVPTADRLRSVARAISSRIDDDRVVAIRVELWGIRFDHPSARIEVFELEEAEVQREAGA